jgi:nitrogen fixation protein NifU and related proteins
VERQDYIDLLIDHYENPRHRGVVDGASVAISGGDPSCGDVVTMYVTVDPRSERVTDIHFVGDGCTISQAGASIMTEEMVGKTLSEIEGMSYDIATELMGRDIVATRLRCATLGLSTLKAAVKKYRGTLLQVTPD